jgi:hypothetical protein
MQKAIASTRRCEIALLIREFFDVLSLLPLLVGVPRRKLLPAGLVIVQHTLIRPWQSANNHHVVVSKSVFQSSRFRSVLWEHSRCFN